MTKNNMSKSELEQFAKLQPLPKTELIWEVIKLRVKLKASEVECRDWKATFDKIERGEL